MRLITITADGSHIRSEPKGSGDYPNWFDKLAPGDQLDYLGISEDGQWYKGRVSYIKSGKYLESRIGRVGWVHKDGVRVTPVQPRPDPIPAPRPPHYGIWALVIAVVLIAAYFAFVR